MSEKSSSVRSVSELFHVLISTLILMHVYKCISFLKLDRDLGGHLFLCLFSFPFFLFYIVLGNFFFRVQQDLSRCLIHNAETLKASHTE